MKDWYRPGEVAELTKSTVSTVANWFDGGLLGGYRMPSGQRRISGDSLAQFMVRNSIPIEGLNAAPLVLLVGFDAVELSTFLPEWNQRGVGTAAQAGMALAACCPQVVVVDAISLGEDAALDVAFVAQTLAKQPVVIVRIPDDSNPAYWREKGCFPVPSVTTPNFYAEAVRTLNCKKRKNGILQGTDLQALSESLRQPA